VDYGVRRRASGGQNKCARYTHVLRDAFSLIGTVVRPTPTKHYRCIHSISNAVPSFDRILGSVCDLSVSLFPGSNDTPQCRSDYGSQGLPSSGLKYRFTGRVSLYFKFSISVDANPRCWGGSNPRFPGQESPQSCLQAVAVIGGQERGTNVHCPKLGELVSISN
jgi:hypothetical protein